MKIVSKTVVAVLSVLSVSAQAKDVNEFNYFGVGFQHNSYDHLDFSPQLEASVLAPLRLDDTSSSIGIRGFAGHQFNRYLAIEGGVTSYGDASFSVIEQGTDADGNTTSDTLQSGEFETLAADVRIIGTYSLDGRLFLKAHLGALAWDNEFTFLTGDPEALNTATDSDSGVSLLTGLGVGYGFNNSIAISLDYQKTEIAKISTENLAVSLLIRF